VVADMSGCFRKSRPSGQAVSLDFCIAFAFATVSLTHSTLIQKHCER
jgi:hypothetical protein